MQKRLSLYPDNRMSHKKREPATTSLEGLSSTLKQFPCRLLEESLPNTKNTKRCSAKRSCKGCHDIQFGIMPSNYFWEPPHHNLGGSFPSPKAKLQKHKNSWPNI